MEELEINKWSPDDMLEVKLSEPDDFLKVKETLTRIGIASHKDKNLYQSCHILHKRGRYYIVHFKELFLLDGKVASLTNEDVERRNTIATLLSDWNLIEFVNPDINLSCAPINKIKTIKFSEKKDWNLIPKYNIGNN